MFPLLHESINGRQGRSQNVRDVPSKRTNAPGQTTTFLPIFTSLPRFFQSYTGLAIHPLRPPPPAPSISFSRRPVCYPPREEQRGTALDMKQCQITACLAGSGLRSKLSTRHAVVRRRFHVSGAFSFFFSGREGDRQTGLLLRNKSSGTRAAKTKTKTMTTEDRWMSPNYVLCRAGQSRETRCPRGEVLLAAHLSSRYLC